MPMKYPPHPGRLVRSDIEALGMGVAETARKLGVSAAQLQSVIDGEASVTPELAVELDRVIGGGAAIWVRLQTAYDEAQERNKYDVPEEPEPLISYPQTAAVHLEHGRLVYTTYDDAVLRFRHFPSGEPEIVNYHGSNRLECRFGSGGPGAVRIQLIYQPSPAVAPRLLADVLFKAYLEWNTEADWYVGRIDAAEWERESQKLRAGFAAMDALRAGQPGQPSGPALDGDVAEDYCPEDHADVLREAEELLHKGTATVTWEALAEAQRVERRAGLLNPAEPRSNL